MAEWLEWARGPAFRACFLIMILGLARAVLLSTLTVLSMMRADRAYDRRVPWGEITGMALKWILPVKSGIEHRAAFSITSMLFHVCIIVTPIFLGAHILLWQRGLGVGWPGIPNLVADYLTLAGIATGVALLAQRVGSSTSRAISRGQDYLLPLLIVVPFATGYLAMHPSISPFDYTGMMFIHVMSGNLLFLAVPFTKISHVALFPGTQLVSHLGWHLAPGAGQKVAEALGKENEPI
jgi:nitrate reductase gamma subunit